MNIRVSAIFVALLAVLAGTAAAQVANTGTILVTVEDSDGGRLPGVTVTATATDTITRRTAVTDAQGVASLEALAPSAQYVITVELAGLPERHAAGRSWSGPGRPRRSRSRLAVAGLTEVVEVSAASPVVDVKSATSGQDITLQLTESLPTGRSYQSYLQLVPGVLPDDQTQSGNPAARSGMNYSDIAGAMGVSTDNVYYFDGMNVTDPVTGTFGANLNTEIIQEQKVITGGIPAEYVGATGLISNVVTKSGSNLFHGSANYFFQNGDLVAENQNGAAQEFSTKDNAYTFGGPLVRDKAWFFGSYRYTNREDDVAALDTNQFLRTVDNTQHQGFAKGSWAVTGDDMISFTYLSDPTEISGRRDRDITNARDRAREQGGHRYLANYTRVWGNTLLEVSANKHNGEVTDLSAIRESAIDVLFRGTATRTLTDEQQGGFGRDLVDQRDNKAIRATLQRAFGSHVVKAGRRLGEPAELPRHDLRGQRRALQPDWPVPRTSLAADIAAGGWSNLQFDVTNTSDFGGFIGTINGRPDRARFYAAFDANGDGTITPAELGARLSFTGRYDRDFQSALGPQETESHGLTFFVQDEWTFNRLTLNLGVRTERGSTTPRPATRSSPSTGPSRRA